MAKEKSKINNDEKFYSVVHRIPTPSLIYNTLHAQGLILGTALEVFGPFKSGKTTFCYQTAQLHLEKYKEFAEVVIIDTECNASACISRLSKGFGLNPGNDEVVDLVFERDERVFLYFIPTIEECFNKVIEHLIRSKEQNKITLIVIDSIANLYPKAEGEQLEKSLATGKPEEAFSQGMMLKSRITTDRMKKMMGYLPHSLATVLMINQVTANIGSYAGGVKSAGGNNKNHQIHASLRMDYGGSKALVASKDADVKAYIDEKSQEDETSKKITYTTLSFDKNKLSICVEKIPLMIKNTESGKFIWQYEAWSVATTLKLVKNSGGWYYFDDMIIDKYKDATFTTSDGTVKTIDKGWRSQDIITSVELMDILKQELEIYYRSNYSTVDDIYTYRQEFIDKKDIKFFV